jgi:hypothetical protein
LEERLTNGNPRKSNEEEREAEEMVEEGDAPTDQVALELID